MLLSALAGYSFAKFRYGLAPVFWMVVLVSVMIPLEAIVIPLFLEVHAFGWTNTYAGLILPTAFNVVGIFIFRQAMVSIPDAYIEAARMMVLANYVSFSPSSADGAADRRRRLHPDLQPDLEQLTCGR